MKNTLLRIAVPTPLRRYFDYLPLPEMDIASLKPGVRVRVPFQRREMIGIFIETTTTSDVPTNKLKLIIEVIDPTPVIDEDILKLGLWVANYYHHPVGEVILGTLPSLIRQGKPAELSRAKPLLIEDNIKDPLILNEDQNTAVTAIQASMHHFKVFLLDGVTGSGKTEVYLQAMAQIIFEDQQVLVLVPEIGLTPQTVQRFRERFPVPVVALHSGMTERQRLHAWLHARSGAAKIIIGTRSAVFTPFANLGLIVVDEEHDLSFKQQESFRYHARDVAIMRAHFNHIPIVLGSATPSLETLHKAQSGRYEWLRLTQRAGKAMPPQFQIVDIRNLPIEQGFSPTLLTAMQQHLQQGSQVMVFLNRRGYAPVLICHACGWMVQCKRCDVRMTYHQKTGRLHCHHCESQKPLLVRCESCGEKTLDALGHGTERLESALAKHFPNYSIARIDRDTTRRKGSMEDVLSRIQNGEHHILVGTQMLAKGHHFPNVTLVAVVDADGGFFSADFRALERMGQLVLQVSGRAGRHEKPGNVMIQTYHPDHPLLHQLLQHGYPAFAAAILADRLAAQLPPFAYFALFRAEAHNVLHATEFLQQTKLALGKETTGLQLMGPLPAPMPRRAGKYRMQLLLQAQQRPLLQQALSLLLPRMEGIAMKHKVRWSVDVDPLEMF